MRRRWLLAAALVVCSTHVRADDTFIFSNNFETGDTMCWSSTTGAMRGLAAGFIAFGAVACHEVESVTPDPAAPGAEITITGTNFGANQGDSEVVYDGDALSIVSWSPTEIVATLPSPKDLGTYDLDVVKGDTVTVAHTIGIIDVDLDDLYGVRNIGDVCFTDDDRLIVLAALDDFTPIIVEYDLATSTLLGSTELLPDEGGFVGDGYELSPNCRYAGGAGSPAVAWDLEDGASTIALGDTGTGGEVRGITSDGVFAIKTPGGSEEGWRFDSNTGVREELVSLPGFLVGTTIGGILPGGTVVGSGDGPNLTNGLVWSAGQSTPFYVEGSSIAAAGPDGTFVGGTSTSILDPYMAVWDPTTWQMSDVVDELGDPAEGEIQSIDFHADLDLGIVGSEDDSATPGNGNLAFLAPGETVWRTRSTTGDAWLQDNLGIVPDEATTKFVVGIQPSGTWTAIAASSSNNPTGTDRVFIIPTQLILDALAEE